MYGYQSIGVVRCEREGVHSRLEVGKNAGMNHCNFPSVSVAA